MIDWFIAGRVISEQNVVWKTYKCTTPAPLSITMKAPEIEKDPLTSAFSVKVLPNQPLITLHYN